MRKIYLFIVGACIAWQLNAQSNPAATYSQANYTLCLEQCADRLAQNSRDSMALYYQGRCLLEQAQYAAALTSLRAAEAANFPAPAITKSLQARCLAGLGETEEAIALLQTLVHTGFANYRPFLSPQFTALEEEAGYAELRDTVHRRAYPCYYDVNYTHFDFWLGEWDVFVGEVKVGENVITKQEGGCAILEQYTTARDYVGQSLNFYDPADGRWKQFWLDKTQSLTKYVETERRSGYLQFVSEADSTPVNSGTLRMTFTLNEDGSVRQYMEQQSIDTKEWQAVFDGLYVRKK